MILGGGVTGLAAGIASGLPVFEAAVTPGGICSSYYRTALGGSGGEDDRDDAYRFEIGGGHWIFGGDPEVLRFIRSQVAVEQYDRRSAVYFPADGRYVSYPLQYHLRELDEDTARRALAEMVNPAPSSRTMAAWLRGHFGDTLNALFFEPFHELYTAGYATRIAPQDAYKSPVDLAAARSGASGPQVGYNATFLYPTEGLDALAGRMASACDVHYGRRVREIDLGAKRVHFDDGSGEEYSRLLSTLPLNEMLEMTGISTDAPADPHTSTLVLNIGARKGDRHPSQHWLYVPQSSSGFHRVGFYSNVDPSFLPRSAREQGTRTSIYVERTFKARPSDEQIDAYSRAVVQELQQWGFISGVEVVDPTWIEVAYTWTWPGSSWVSEAIARLEAQNVHQVGRYARWTFQGIADSIRDGFAAGERLR